MEIKAVLKQPYTDKERENFIVEQNHKLGYEIRQVETTYEVEIQVPSIIKETITETIQEPVLDDDGNLILDEEDNPTFEEKNIEREVERAETEIVTEEIQVPVLDEEGNPVLNNEGNPTFETQTIEKEVVKYKTEIVEKTGYNLEAWGYTDEEKQEQERERINLLSMTRGDMFEAIILAFGKTKADIRSMIESVEGLTDIERALYLNRFDEALDFYRGYPAIDLIGKMLGVSSEQLDKFFKTKDYHELLPVEDNTINNNTTSQEKDNNSIMEGGE